MMTRQEEYQYKHDQVLQYMQSHDLDAVVLTKRCNFAWFTCGGQSHVGTAADVGAASLLIFHDRVLCITNRIEAQRIADEEVGELGIEVRAAQWYDSKELAAIWADAIGHARVGFDVKAAGLPEFAKGLKGDFDALRRVMCAGEIERFRVLARDTAGGVETTARQAKKGMSEWQLAAKLTACLMEKRIRVPVALVAADDRIARYRHPIPTTRKFEKYGMIVCGAERDGLMASCSRLFSFGPISNELRRKHEAVCQIDAAMIGDTRPGRTLGDVFETCKAGYADTGFPEEWKCHHQGGSTGYLAREVKGTTGNPTPVQVNQLFAWNPSIAGTKSEDTILVGPNANEILTATGTWPTTDYNAGGRNWPRCNILCI